MTASVLLDHPLVCELLSAGLRKETVSEDARLVWHIWGDGPPLMLLHGSHGGWMHWIRNIGALAARWTVFVPDLPGFGESDPPADLESPAAHARLIARGYAQLGIADATIDVVGFSLGALLGCWLSLEPGVTVRRLILADAGGLGTPLRSAQFQGAKGVKGEALREVNRVNLGAMMLHDPASIDDLAIDIAMAYATRVRTRVQFHVIPDKLLPIVSRVRAPIDLIWGEHDFPHPDPERNAAAVRAVQPEAALRVVEDAGHWSMYERPERFNAALIDLLTRPPRPALPGQG